ncbi:tetratricopeptide repeat protein [Streptomyces sp. IBSNAI002]|uniref:tetratricopeptide repeat protein n=1 Tax=Streptomyces sp. IBSNAI002 TaxID=3457500 RepID=UPI003FD0D30A
MSERTDEIHGTALGVVVENYRHPAKFPALTGATAQMRELCALLETRGYTPTVLPDPGQPDLVPAVKGWATGRGTDRLRGPAVILWSGHGVLDRQELRLVLHDTEDARYGDETYSANLLTEAALRSGADQMLLLIDTCHAGAGVMESLDTAFSRLTSQNLPPGRSGWLGVLASSRPQEKAEAAGILLETLTRVLREGPRSEDYRHEWSSRNGQVSGATVIHAVLAQWPDEVGHKPVPAMFGEPRLMFDNPLRKAVSEPDLVEHLVRASRGAPVDDGGWFFSGRRNVLGRITEWLGARQPGLFLVTGSAGCGKSAVLGRVATLSDPVHRADILEHGALAPEDPDPGEGSVDASLHLRGHTVQQLAEAIAGELGLPVPQTPAALIAEVEKNWPAACADRLPALVLDGLDEAAPDQAYPVVEQLLAPLSRLVCVLLGSRDRPFRPQEDLQEPLDEAVRRLGGVRARASDLDDEADTEHDIRTYCRRRMEAREMPPGDAATAAGLIADRASAHTGGFLFARMATDSVIRRFTAAPEASEDWAQAIPLSISAAFTEDLAEGPERERDGVVLPHAAQDLLTALAWSAGNGMPARGVWEAAASALAPGDTAYGPEDVDWLLNTYGRYVVEDSDGTQAVYRLYHREFIGHLREARDGADGSDGAYRVASALVGLLREQTAEATQTATANPYLRRSLAAHAAMAGERGVTLIRDLVTDRGDAFRLDLARVLGGISLSRTRVGRRIDALAPAREAADLFRNLADGDPDAYLPALAMSLNNLANAQRAIGDREGALATITETTALRRDLAREEPAAHLPNLAGALNNLANAQGATGDRLGALATVTEATNLYRGLATANPAAYLPELAMSLNNLANAQSSAGDDDGALATVSEAIALYRDLAAANPANYLPNLAGTLNNLANAQSATGDREGALATITESVALYRDLAAANPAAFLPDLATSLNNLANCQSTNGDNEGALANVIEAADLYRELADDNPAAYLPELAGTLNNLSTTQNATGDRRGALANVTEATDLYRSLAAANPAAYLPDLAMSLSNLATAHGATGDKQGALAHVTEATDLYRSLATANPAAHRAHLAICLNNLSAAQGEAGDRRGALATIVEATGLYRSLAAANRAAYLPDLAICLNNLATAHSATGDSQGALAAITEATDLRRTLATAHPAAYLPDLATSLNNLAAAHSATGDSQGALAAITEATDLRRTLATAHPTAHLPDLVRSLAYLSHMGTVHDALAAYEIAERALATHPEAVRILALGRARLEVTQSDSAVGVRTLICLIHSPAPQGRLDPTAFQARRLLRRHSQTDSASTHLTSALWREETGGEPPAWLTLKQGTVDLVIDWINCPTWPDSRAFWDAHAEGLGAADTVTALEEAALISTAAEAHLEIVHAVMATDADTAFRPFLIGTLLHTWIGAATWEESQVYLTDHSAELLHDQALELLGSDTASVESVVHHALLTLARALGIPHAYRCIEDRSALDDRLRQILSASEAEPDLLRAVAFLESSVHGEPFTGTAHLAIAGALAGGPPGQSAWPSAEPALRDRVISEIAELIGRHPAHASALSALIQSLVAA